MTKNIVDKIIRVGSVAVVSAILTVPSMELVKNVPGNSFKTEMDFAATTFLVFILWFSLILFFIWFIRFLANSQKLRQNPASPDAPLMIERKEKDLKTASTLKK